MFKLFGPDLVPILPRQCGGVAVTTREDTCEEASDHQVVLIFLPSWLLTKMSREQLP